MLFRSMAENGPEFIDRVFAALARHQVDPALLQLELTEGVGQAKKYAGKMAVRYAYSTNGQGIYGIDMQEGTEGEITVYPTPEQLWNLTFAEANAWRDRFASVPFPDKGGNWTLRYYQQISVERVLERIGHKIDRILLTLATGTGKTSIASSVSRLCWLMRAHQRSPKRRSSSWMRCDACLMSSAQRTSRTRSTSLSASASCRSATNDAYGSSPASPRFSHSRMMFFPSLHARIAVAR